LKLFRQMWNYSGTDLRWNSGRFIVLPTNCFALLRLWLKGRGNPVKCLSHRQTSELACLSSHYFFHCWTATF